MSTIYNNQMKLLFLIPLIVFALPVFADTTPALIVNHAGREEKKITIAVMNFDANNCQISLGNAVSDMITGKLFECRQFILLERSRIQLAALHYSTRNKSTKDPDRAAAIGRMVSVEKVIVGSVNKIGYFRIETRIIDVQSGAIDVSLPITAHDEYDIQNAVDAMVERIDNYYLGIPPISGKYDLAATMEYILPVGDFSRGIAGGYGCRLSYSLNTFPLPALMTSCTAGVFHLDPEQDSTRSYYIAPVTIHCGRPFVVNTFVRFTPSIGGGYLFSRIDHDDVEIRTYGDREYRTRYFRNPLISVRGEFHIKLSYRWHLAFLQDYSVFFENNRRGYFISTGIGAKTLF